MQKSWKIPNFTRRQWRGIWIGSAVLAVLLFVFITFSRWYPIWLDFRAYRDFKAGNEPESPAFCAIMRQDGTLTHWALTPAEYEALREPLHQMQDSHLLLHQPDTSESYIELCGVAAKHIVLTETGFQIGSMSAVCPEQAQVFAQIQQYLEGLEPKLDPKNVFLHPPLG